MDQPRPGTQIKRDLQRYRITGVKLSKPIFWRDLILTILVWFLFLIGLYNAFLYVDDIWINRLPNPTRQVLVDLKDLAHAIQFYTYFSLGALVLMGLRFLGNLQFWFSKKDEAVTLSQIPVEAQAKVFGADPHLVSAGRASKITYVRIDTDSGLVAEMHPTNDPHHKPFSEGSVQ